MRAQRPSMLHRHCYMNIYISSRYENLSLRKPALVLPTTKVRVIGTMSRMYNSNAPYRSEEEPGEHFSRLPEDKTPGGQQPPPGIVPNFRRTPPLLASPSSWA